MDLKNAVAVCLISLFSATLVLLIARALDIRAASRVEPQLERIATELEALRKQGGIRAAGGAADSDAPADGLVVYYFYGNQRCLTCRAIESQSHEVLQSDFASQLEDESIVWKILNYEEPANANLARQFEIQVPVIVLVKMEGGQVADWERLDEVWALVGDKPAFAEFIRDRIAQMLAPAGTPPAGEPQSEAPDIPAPTADPSDIPVPDVPDDLPLPEQAPAPSSLPE